MSLASVFCKHSSKVFFVLLLLLPSRSWGEVGVWVGTSVFRLWVCSGLGKDVVLSAGKDVVLSASSLGLLCGEVVRAGTRPKTLCLQVAWIENPSFSKQSVDSDKSMKNDNKYPIITMKRLRLDLSITFKNRIMEYNYRPSS